jgi:hypothetical protein
MSDVSDFEGAAVWHWRFAAAANNLAWDLSDQTGNAVQDREMLDVAQASAWHWTKVGSDLSDRPRLR